MNGSHCSGAVAEALANYMDGTYITMADRKNDGHRSTAQLSGCTLHPSCDPESCCSSIGAMSPRDLQTLPFRRRQPLVRCFLLAAMLTLTVHAQSPVSGPGSGISRELARRRAARVSDLRYDLFFALERGSRQTRGTETLTFHLSDASANLPLDFRDGTLEHVELNGHALPGELSDGHLQLPANALQSGKNTVILRFTSARGHRRRRHHALHRQRR